MMLMLLLLLLLLLMLMMMMMIVIVIVMLMLIMKLSLHLGVVSVNAFCLRLLRSRALIGVCLGGAQGLAFSSDGLPRRTCVTLSAMIRGRVSKAGKHRG